MAYYEESTYLDLSKGMYQMEYESIVPQAVVDEYKDDGDELTDKVDFSTNAYLFFKEKDIIKKDVLNLCAWIDALYLSDGSQSEAVKKFPCSEVHNRVSQIL